MPRVAASVCDEDASSAHSAEPPLQEFSVSEKLPVPLSLELLTTIMLQLGRQKEFDNVYLVGSRTYRHMRFLKAASKWHRAFRRGNLLLLIFCVAVMPIVVPDLTASPRLYRGSELVFGVSVALLLISLLGMYGASRLREDIHIDLDARETPAQLLLELYFWTMICTLVVLVGGTIIVFLDGYRQNVQIADTAARFPDEFRSVASRYSIDTSPGSGSVEATSQLTWMVDVGFAIGSAVTTLSCGWLLKAAKEMVTTFEIMEGMMRWMAVLYTFVGGLLLYLGSVAIAFITEQAQVSPLPVVWFWFLTSFFTFQMAQGLLMVPVGLLGVLAKRKDDYNQMKVFITLAKYNMISLVLDATIATVIGAGALDGLADQHCKELLQFGHRDWFSSLSGRAFAGHGCSKYYGQALAVDESGVMQPSSGSVGPWVTCNDPSEQVYAWEANFAVQGACGEQRAYGCLNMACCSVVKELLQLFGTMLAVVAMFGLIAMYTGALGAKYMVSHHLLQLHEALAGDAIAVAAFRKLASQRRLALQRGQSLAEVVTDIRRAKSHDGMNGLTSAPSPPPSPPSSSRSRSVAAADGKNESRIQRLMHLLLGDSYQTRDDYIKEFVRDAFVRENTVARISEACEIVKRVG